MRAKELQQRKLEDLRTMVKTLRDETFAFRMQNMTSRLDKTSELRRSRRELARVLTILRQREKGGEKAETAAPAAAAAGTASK